MRWPAVSAGLAAVTLAAAGVAGCTGSSTAGSSSGKNSAPRAAAAASAAAAPASGIAGGTSSSSAGSSSTGSVAVDLAAAERSRILTATVTERVADIGAAVAIASGAAAGAGGYLGSATTTAASGPGTAPTANLVLRVPDARFGDVLSRVSGLGTVVSSAQTESDVTGQVADLASRLATQQASIARVRVLFAKATSVGQVVALESALTERESTLESLQAQQRALAGQVGDATIALTLLGPGVVVRAVHRPVHHSGFVSGLRAGWHALTALGRGVAVVAGALLPFVPVFVVLAAVGWWLARRRPRHDPPTKLPAATPPPA